LLPDFEATIRFRLEECTAVSRSIAAFKGGRLLTGRQRGWQETLGKKRRENGMGGSLPLTEILNMHVLKCS